METFNNAVEQLKPLFDSIAEKIGQGAEFGWVVVLKQQIVYGVGWGIASVVAYSVAIGGAFLLRWGFKNQDDTEISVVAMMFGGSALILGLILGSMFLFSAVARFLNPEYYALQFFISLVGVQ